MIFKTATASSSPLRQPTYVRSLKNVEQCAKRDSYDSQVGNPHFARSIQDAGCAGVVNLALKLQRKSEISPGPLADVFISYPTVAVTADRGHCASVGFLRGGAGSLFRVIGFRFGTTT